MGAPFTHPYRTSPDTLNDIRHDLDGLLAHLPKLAPITPPASLDAARALWMRQALEAAADHAAALLPLLDAPILVEADTVTFDRSAALDALDAAVVALDALDADPDLEDEPDDEFTGDDELSLGWREAVRQLDLGLGADDGEPTLGAPERHPHTWTIGGENHRPANGSYYRAARYQSQASWAQGARQDGEGESEPGYDLPEGDDERCGSEHDGAEPDERDQNLGAPAGDGDQRHWAQGDAHDCEQAVDGNGELPADWYKRPVGPFLPRQRLDWLEQRTARRDLTQHVAAIKGRHRISAPGFDHDTVTPIGPGMVSWGGPARHPLSLCNVHPVAMPVRVVGP